MIVVEEAEKDYMKKKIPDISVGDQVEVSSKIVEGDKERIQKFIGVVIAKKGSGINANFTVRRIVQGEGTERIFPIHSPIITKVTVVKSSKVRRAKLYYLRDRKGKNARLKEKLTKRTEKKAIKPRKTTKTETTKEKQSEE
ncbi:MAG: 50S ribosomal protein L19 [Candidatus Anammoxibacter sp.]